MYKRFRVEKNKEVRIGGTITYICSIYDWAIKKFIDDTFPTRRKAKQVARYLNKYFRNKNG